MNNLDIEAIKEAIKSAHAIDKAFVGLHEPCFGGNEWDYVKECIDTTWISSVGKYVDRFEAMLAEFTGVKRAIATVNGTAALHMALMLAGVEKNDEVILPALTFVATANAVCYCNAVPHFVDIEEETLGLDPFKLSEYLDENAKVEAGECFNIKTGRRIKAAVPVHTFGHPVNMDQLLDVCHRHNITIVEDAAESIGSYYKGKHTGNFGKIAILSFNGNKTITTGGGGAVLTNDDRLGSLAKHLTTTAKVPHRWEYRHNAIGYNYRLPNINAAIGCGQMEQLPQFLDQKRYLARRYQEAFKDVKGVRFFTEPPFAKSNYWLNVLLLDEVLKGWRDKLLAETNDSGIMTRPVWELLNTLPMFKDCPAMDLRCAENLAKRLINIPSSAFLGRKNA